MHELDTRPWKLLAGLTILATGCGDRAVSPEGEGSSSSTGGDSEGTQTGPTSTTADAEEEEGEACLGDCPSGYYCMEGICYESDPDTSSAYECYDDSECDLLEVCSDLNYCESPASPVPDCESPPVAPLIPLDINGDALALSFVDVDDDSVEELVVATQTELLVFDVGGGPPQISPRVIESAAISAMSAGPLDIVPGEDLAILHGDNTRLIHSSDGMGGFMAPAEDSVPLLAASGLIVADFDAMEPHDMLAWGSDGASLELGGPALQLTLDSVFGAAYRPPEAGGGAIALREQPSLVIVDLDGQPLMGFPLGGIDADAPLVSMGSAGLGFYVSSRRVNAAGASNAWTWLRFFAADTGVSRDSWGLALTVDVMASGDLDGDGRDELVLAVDDSLWIYRDALAVEQCVTEVELQGPGLGIIAELALGDFDGDLDDELALRFELGEVAILDDEG